MFGRSMLTEFSCPLRAVARDQREWTADPLAQTCEAGVMNGSTIDVPTPDGVADCYLTKPAGDGARPGVLFMIDAIGLRPRIEQMADRIAAQGYVVLAPNVFYRAGRAPLWETPDLHDPDSRGRFFQSLGPLMGAFTPAAVAVDGGAYLDKLGELTDGPVGVTGYCFGGRLGWMIAAAHSDRVAALGGFHTGRMVTDDEDSPHLLVCASRAGSAARPSRPRPGRRGRSPWSSGRRAGAASARPAHRSRARGGRS